MPSKPTCRPCRISVVSGPVSPAFDRFPALRSLFHDACQAGNDIHTSAAPNYAAPHQWRLALPGSLGSQTILEGFHQQLDPTSEVFVVLATAAEEKVLTRQHLFLQQCRKAGRLCVVQHKLGSILESYHCLINQLHMGLEKHIRLWLLVPTEKRATAEARAMLVGLYVGPGSPPNTLGSCGPVGPWYHILVRFADHSQGMRRPHILRCLTRSRSRGRLRLLMSRSRRKCSSLG